jgi:RNA polymerase sigma-70 factor (sigma-E family)
VPEERAGVEKPERHDLLRMAFEQHHVALLRLCLLLTARREDAEEIVQESFVRAAPKLSGLEETVVGPYLRQTAVNLWRNRLRRMRLELRARSQAPTPAAGAEGSFEERDRMWEVVRRLPPRRRACVVLRYYEDLPEREVAAILGCSVGTVKSQTSRALQALRKELEGGSGG